MAHRSLSLQKFVHHVPWELFQRYFDEITVDPKPSPWAAFGDNGALLAFLDVPENAAAAAHIIEDFQRINDLCTRNQSLLVRGYKQAGVTPDWTLPLERLAMLLFLDHRYAFEFAWAQHLIYHGGSKLSCYVIGYGANADPDFSDGVVAQLEQSLSDWFEGLAKGKCQVRAFRQDDQLVFLITRGSYFKTFGYWEDERVAFASFRPVMEDVLAFSLGSSELTIKASLAKDRSQYLKLFSSAILGDASLAEKAEQGEVFSLVPLQTGRFNFAGDEHISHIRLTKVRLELGSEGAPTVEIHANDVLQVLDRDLQPFTLKMGRPVSATFQAVLHPDNEQALPVSFEVEPPSRSDFTRKQHADIIDRYLREQSVRLA